MCSSCQMTNPTMANFRLPTCSQPALQMAENLTLSSCKQVWVTSGTPLSLGLFLLCNTTSLSSDVPYLLLSHKCRRIKNILWRENQTIWLWKRQRGFWANSRLLFFIRDMVAAKEGKKLEYSQPRTLKNTRCIQHQTQPDFISQKRERGFMFLQLFSTRE